MTRTDHYRFAEQELENARTEEEPAMESYYLKAAHVHAMLAVADYVAEIGDQLDSFPRRHMAQDERDRR